MFKIRLGVTTHHTSAETKCVDVNLNEYEGPGCCPTCNLSAQPRQCEPGLVSANPLTISMSLARVWTL